MVTSRSVAVPHQADKAHLSTSPQVIDRMAAELRARSDADLPHAFYVAQVRRQLMVQGSQIGNAQSSAKKKPEISVFHAWAMPD